MSHRSGRVPHLLSKRTRGYRMVFRERKLQWAFMLSVCIGMILFSTQAGEGGAILAGSGAVGGAFCAYLIWRFTELELDPARGRRLLRWGRGGRQVEESGVFDDSSMVASTSTSSAMNPIRERALEGGLNVLGLPVLLWSLPNQEIEGVDQAEFTSLGRRYTGVRIRSDERVVYLGRHLGSKGERWLADRIRAHLVQ